ncbi:MAG: hypothetical protein IKN27_02075 [Selenomonadaceae bacterium]|nr:hypothetical protein [Selenomonadaceae bacterium]
MNIAIVVDEKILSEAVEIVLRVYIRKFWSEYESRIHIEVFQRAKEFLTFFSPQNYQLVILGVNMKDIASVIRANGCSDVKIFFLNDSEEV